MPLPDAVPKPPGSNIYHQLNAFKLGELTNEQLAIVRDPLFLNDRSEDELRRLALIGQARQSLSVSSSGPIPGTGYVTDLDQTDGNIITILEPGPGEVWAVVGGSVTGTSVSGTVCYHLLTANKSDAISGSTDRSKATLIVEVCGTAGQVPLNESVPYGEVYIDENMCLYAQATGTFTSIAWKISLIRVR